MADGQADKKPDEYEAPAVVVLGSVDDLTRVSEGDFSVDDPG